VLTKAEAVSMVTSQLQMAPPQTEVNTKHALRDLLPAQVDSQENRERKVITYQENGLSRIVLQSRVQEWTVKNAVIRAENPVVAWAGHTRPELFKTLSTTAAATRFNGSPFVPEASDAAYPLPQPMSFLLRDVPVTGSPPQFQTWMNLFSWEAVEVFNHSILTEAAKAYNQACVAEKARAAKLMRAAFFKLSDRKQFFAAAVKILGRRPTYNEVTLVQIMWPAIEPLMDTPIIIEPALRFHLRDIMKRLKPETTRKAVDRAAAATSASITFRAKREIDPNGVMLPRQWRWLMRQKAITLRRLPNIPRSIPKAWQFALYAEFFPDMRKYHSILTTLREPLMTAITKANGTDELPEIASVFLRALRRHVDGVKNKAAPYANSTEQYRMLKALLENAHAIEMDTELRQANLGTLYDLTRNLNLVSMEPEASLRFERQAFDFPFSSKNITFGDYEFVPLRDHVMVYEEGQRFRHCVFEGHMRSMIHGDSRGYTVIRMRDDAPVGTLLLHRNRNGESFRYEVSQFAGQLNQNLLYEYAEPMRAFVAHLNAEGKHG
jgi:hypothetical protein